MVWIRWMMVAGFGLGVGACQTRTESLEAMMVDSEEADCDYVGTRTAETFATLTANVWEGSGCQPTGDALPPTCHTLTLAADGTYSWTAVSDYEERNDSGSWTFYETNRGGHVAFDDGSFIGFAIEDGQLQFLDMEFTPTGPSGGAGELTALGDLTPSSLYCDLVETSWTKSNPFGLSFRPQSIAYFADGTFDAGYRAGACSHGGAWSLYTESVGTGAPTSPQRTETRLYANAEDNRCDVRDGGSSAHGLSGTPRWIDASVVLKGEAYHPDDGLDRDDLLVFDRYGGMLETQVRTDAFEPGRTLALDVRFVNVAPARTLTPEAFIVTQRLGDGAETTVLQTPLQGNLKTGDVIEATATLEMPSRVGDEPLVLGFATVFEDDRGSRFDAAQHVQID